MSRNITVLTMLGQMSWSIYTPEAIWDLWTRSSSADVHLAHDWWRGDNPFIQPATAPFLGLSETAQVGLFFGSGHFLPKMPASCLAFRYVPLIWSWGNWNWQMMVMINYGCPVNVLLRWSANKFPYEDTCLRKWNISRTWQYLSTDWRGSLDH